MNWLQVDDYSGGGWTRTADSLARATHYCSELEKGAILVFSAPPFELPGHDVDFLVSLNTRESRFHKNISYRPGEDLLRGFGDPANRPALHGVMRRFATEARKFAANFLLPFTGSFQMDYASFRPLEEKGRNLP